MESVREAVSVWAEDAKRNAGWVVFLGALSPIAGISMITIGSAART